MRIVEDSFFIVVLSLIMLHVCRAPVGFENDFPDENPRRMCNDIDCDHGNCVDDVTFDGGTSYVAYCNCNNNYYGPFCQDRDGSWGDWNDYGACSVTCGIGTMTRDRTCRNSEGSGTCTGSSSETAVCKVLVDSETCVCENPPTIRFGTALVNLTNDLYGTGEEVSYQCSTGYSFQDISVTSITCQGGTWSTPYPSCVVSGSGTSSGGTSGSGTGSGDTGTDTSGSGSDSPGSSVPSSSEDSWIDKWNNQLYLAVIGVTVVLGIIAVATIVYCCRKAAKKNKNAGTNRKPRKNNRTEDQEEYLPPYSESERDVPFSDNYSPSRTNGLASHLTGQDNWQYYM